MFSTKRLKKKSQSVDIASQGFSPTLLPASPLNRVAPPVAKATAGLGVQDNNTTNSQHRSPRFDSRKEENKFQQQNLLVEQHSTSRSYGAQWDWGGHLRPVGILLSNNDDQQAH
ncbi:hypothetical protein fugu_010415 [Takifugu bimaculatus]|uniref:Uncharacterized protein n=1 Tax=Takifugu bimaculatus TaxID=433685 RepID=A0A4Z2CFA0_9TELE|nr:hypothetical protein fugu_010415 [Takifugu bimaculatus]